jgi:hypothetical protein
MTMRQDYSHKEKQTNIPFSNFCDHFSNDSNVTINEKGHKFSGKKQGKWH